MQDAENYSNQRTKIAEKSKWTALTFIVGFVICIAVACVTMIAKPQFWILYFCLFVAIGVVFLGCGIYDIKRPKVVIETD